jgi:hypothetical protein
VLIVCTSMDGAHHGQLANGHGEGSLNQLSDWSENMQFGTQLTKSSPCSVNISLLITICSCHHGDRRVGIPRYIRSLCITVYPHKLKSSQYAAGGGTTSRHFMPLSLFLLERRRNCEWLWYIVTRLQPHRQMRWCTYAENYFTRSPVDYTRTPYYARALCTTHPLRTMHAHSVLRIHSVLHTPLRTTRLEHRMVT